MNQRFSQSHFGQSQTIGGSLDTNAYARLAARPPKRTRDEIRCAVAELRARGLRYRDISLALGIAEPEVIRLIGEAVAASEAGSP